MKKVSIYILSIFLLTVVYSQAQQTTNVSMLEQLAVEYDAEWREAQQRVAAYSTLHNLPVREEYPSGTVVLMVDVVDGQPQYIKTFNYGAAITTRVDKLWPGGINGFDLTGDGYNQIGQWDGGQVRNTHVEFNQTGSGRIIRKDAASLSGHATHVAGTIIAGGVNSEAKGMMYEGILQAWYFSNDDSEMSSAAANGLEISNHSYGSRAGWDYNESNGQWSWYGNDNIDPNEDYLFGFYSSSTRTWDNIAYQAPYYLIVTSAGNDRGEGPGNAGQNGNPERDGGEDGYDCLPTSNLGKNVLTVGAVNEVLNYQGPQSVNISSFSSWGPTDDGRIKPDVVGKGVGVYSTYTGSNTDYATLQGTSMSSPNVAGSLGLLQKYYQDTHNEEIMKSATLKALAIHTADEAGPHEGPDYVFGWGLINAERAALVIKDDLGQDIIDERTLQEGQTYTREVYVNGNTDLRVTIAWTDRPGFPVSPQLNPRDPAIVHDLDLRITRSGDTYYPYRLDYDNPEAAAVTISKNFVDNVEQIYIADAEEGNYTIIVDHDGDLVTDQDFSIIISGIEEYTVTPECITQITYPADGSNDNLINPMITWNPANYATSYDVHLGTDGNGQETPTNVLNGENVMDNHVMVTLEPSQTYYVQINPRNNVGVSECGEIWSFTTMDPISNYPYTQDLEGADVPDFPMGWQAYNNTPEAGWIVTDQIGNANSDNSFGNFNPFVQAVPINDWLISPPFQVDAAKEYMVSMFVRAFLSSTAEQFTLYWGTGPMIEDMTQLMVEVTDQNNTWTDYNVLIAPDVDGQIYFGIHHNTFPGVGLFVDDFQIQDFGPVSVDELQKKDVKVYFDREELVIYSAEQLRNAEVIIYNAMGQLVGQHQFDNTSTFRASIDGQAGVYIVQLKADKQISLQTKVIKTN